MDRPPGSHRRPAPGVGARSTAAPTRRDAEPGRGPESVGLVVRLTAFPALAVSVALVLGLALALAGLRPPVGQPLWGATGPADSSHDHGAAVAGAETLAAQPRRVLGPLLASGPGAAVQLEASVVLDQHDPRARWPLAAGIPAGEKILLDVRITDPETGAPLTGLAPTVDLAPASGVPADRDGPTAPRDPFQVSETFVLAGAAGEVGVVEGGGAHVHRPGAGLTGMTGSSVTSTRKLPGPAADAVADPTGRFLFVSLPENDAVAVVDALTRAPVHSVPVGKLPHHLAVEPSGQRVWVANDGDGTVTAIDAATHATRISRVGAGHHELAFSDDARRLFVSNNRSGTVSVLDAQTGQSVADVPVGGGPHGLDYAPLTRRLYVANEGDGTVSVLAAHGERPGVLATIPAGAGTTQVRIDPTGRVGVASNKRANTLTVFDADSYTVLRTVPSGKGPDAIVFLEDYAVVRNGLSPDVTFVNLTKPEVSDNVLTGEEPALDGAHPIGHARLFLDATGQEALVPSPVEGKLHHLHVMMGRPMAMDQTKVDRGSDLVLSLGERVREIAPGTYRRVVRFDRVGAYTLGLGLAERASGLTFPLDVVTAQVEKPWSVEPVPPPRPYVAGEEAVVQFKISARDTGAPEEAIADGVITLYRFTPGQGYWQQTLPAEHVAGGLYRARVVLPEAGAFAAAFSSRQLGLGPTDGARAVLEVVAR